MRVQHRHIIYVQGYDPRGLAQYYRMFRTELRKFGRLYQLAATISRPQSAPDGETASWTIETKAGDWQTRTSYDFLRWEDLIQRDLAAPIWRTVFHADVDLLAAGFGGTIARFWRAHWRFATFISYPHFLLFIEALFSLRHSVRLREGFGSAGHSRHVQYRCIGGLVRRIPRQHAEIHGEFDISALFALRHDLDLGILHRQRPEWDERIDRFAQHLAKVARTSNAEEIVVVGHSSGSFLGVEISRARSSSIRRLGGTVRALSYSRSAAISRSWDFTPSCRTSAITFARWRSNLRSTGSTASRARM